MVCRSRLELTFFFYHDLAGRAEKVSRSVKEGHGRVSEHREDMPKRPDFANSAFGNPSGGASLKGIYIKRICPCSDAFVECRNMEYIAHISCREPNRQKLENTVVLIPTPSI